jgi:hypothetical protein
MLIRDYFNLLECRDFLASLLYLGNWDIAILSIRNKSHNTLLPTHRVSCVARIYSGIPPIDNEQWSSLSFWELHTHNSRLGVCKLLFITICSHYHTNTTNPHWARVVGYCPFALCVIHKEGLCPSSGNINRLMMMMTIQIIVFFISLLFCTYFLYFFIANCYCKILQQSRLWKPSKVCC